MYTYRKNFKYLYRICQRMCIDKREKGEKFYQGTLYKLCINIVTIFTHIKLL